MARPGNGTIIIKKIKKGGHGGHHGGSWKVAYADFVTAMMAFFLLLWLLNVTTDVQKRGIADYFDPAIALKSAQSGADGLLGGKVIGAPGSMTANATAPSLSMPMPAMRQPDDGDEGNEDGAPGHADDSAKTDPKADKLDDVARLRDEARKGEKLDELAQLREEAKRDPAKLNDPELRKKLASLEEREFAA